MKMTKSVLPALLLAGALAPRAAAYSQPNSWYLGAAIGQSQSKDTCDEVPVPCDDKDTAWRVFGGYQFNPFLGAELGYADLGAPFSASGTASGIPIVARSEVTAWDVVAVASYPIERFSVYGKLGMYRAETDSTGTVGSEIITASDTNTGLTFGLGAAFAITRNLALRGEWQRYKDVGGDDVGEDHVDVLSIALAWRF